jgi:hypothetical protein
MLVLPVPLAHLVGLLLVLPSVPLLVSVSWRHS